MKPSKPKPRRQRVCAREGCKRGVRDGYRCCSVLVQSRRGHDHHPRAWRTGDRAAFPSRRFGIPRPTRMGLNSDPAAETTRADTS